MKRLFLDANVLFTAAHNPKGKAALVIELAESGYWEVISSAYAVAEARRNLQGKFPLRLDGLEALLASIRLVPTPGKGQCPFPLASKDHPIFLAAHAAGATHLLTGDLKDFGPFMNAPEQTLGMTIQTVAQFLQRLG